MNTFSGKCGCRPGFTSDACNACPGGQIQWLEGIPSCVTMYVSISPYLLSILSPIPPYPLVIIFSLAHNYIFSNSNGNPATCNYDYECSNSPYAFCDGTCVSFFYFVFYLSSCSPSPHLPISPSPHLPISPSPHLPISPSLHLSISPSLLFHPFDNMKKCRPGFSGAQCSTCTGAVTWKAGLPKCQ